MDPSLWERLGVISKTQGNEGELLLKVDKDFPDPNDPEEPVFIPIEREDEGTPFYFAYCQRINQKQYILRFELIDDEGRASRLIGMGVYLPRSSYPEKEEEEKSLLERVQGFRVIDRERGGLGRIQGGLERSEQPLAYLGKDGTPIPLTDALIERVDEEEKILYTYLPEGLTEL